MIWLSGWAALSLATSAGTYALPTGDRRRERKAECAACERAAHEMPPRDTPIPSDKRN